MCDQRLRCALCGDQSILMPVKAPGMLRYVLYDISMFIPYSYTVLSQRRKDSVSKNILLVRCAGGGGGWARWAGRR